MIAVDGENHDVGERLGLRAAAVLLMFSLAVAGCGTAGITAAAGAAGDFPVEVTSCGVTTHVRAAAEQGDHAVDQ
ncbi:MAG: hypothetical protein ACRDZO_06180 [Egibacteraceae bacterium]